ncbi:hypothetical protein AB0436_08500 [Streptomyces sp. NPDC051322]|uniref:hypothetical protein n=1 Tax=Streptomyces sp. NPDC051322 TaxID=3154645 RepID=UPI00344D2A58
MFDHNVTYPCAVASHEPEGVSAAIDWCCEHMKDGDTITVWTSLRRDVRNCSELEQLVNRRSNVEHVTGRGGGSIRGNGPVLMAWPDMAAIGELVQYSGDRIRALCVIAWNEDEIRPWVTTARPAILGDDRAWEELTPQLDPVVVEALTNMTSMVNLNNTISASGFDKDVVVGHLLALHDASIRMDGKAMQGWVLANGWAGRNPEHLAKYVADINAAKRPRCSPVLRPDYLASLRRQAADGS